MNGIKLMRENQKITQKELGIKLNIAQSTVGMWESGKRNPRADRLPELAKILKCSIDELFKETAN